MGGEGKLRGKSKGRVSRGEKKPKVSSAYCRKLPGWLSGKESCQCRRYKFHPLVARSLEKGMATHSSILAWEIPWTEEPGGLQPMGSQRVGHN